jgi:hypothetical protein
VVGESFRAIDARLGHKNAAMAAGTPRETLPTAAEAGLTVTDFRALTADFAHHNLEHQEEARRSAAEHVSTASGISLTITSPMKAGARRRTLLQQRAQRADNRAGGLTKPWAGPISHHG